MSYEQTMTILISSCIMSLCFVRSNPIPRQMLGMGGGGGEHGNNKNAVTSTATELCESW